MSIKDGSNINVGIKIGAFITGIALLMLAILGYLAKDKMESYDTQFQKQWGKITKLEKVTCKNHPDDCKLVIN